MTDILQMISAWDGGMNDLLQLSGEKKNSLR